MAQFDLLVTPTMACLPPEVGAWRVGMDVDPMMGLFNVFPMGIFTSLFNVTGLPAISVPVHVDEATGLPVGVQIVAAPWQEDMLLQVAAQLEEASPGPAGARRLTELDAATARARPPGAWSVRPQARR